MTTAAYQTFKFQLLTDEEIDQLPDPEWLVDGIVPFGGLAVLAGPPGIGKSFVAIDWAYSVSLGIPWLDHPSKAGPVIYVAAEGKVGLKLRQSAWKQHKDVDDCPNMRYLPEAVQLLNGADVEALVGAVRALAEKPVLIVFDTLARCFLGGEENSATDMGRLVAASDRLRYETGATVLLIHHTGKQKSGNQMKLAARGSSALDGAADLMMRLLSTKSGGLSLICDKQKEGASFKPISLALKQVAIDDDQHSCVVVASDQLDSPSELTAKHSAVVDYLQRLGGADGHSEGPLEELAIGRYQDRRN